MHCKSAKLPADQRQRVHPDFLVNEKAYFRMRDHLLEQYEGQWVAVHDGQVIASGVDLYTVGASAADCAGHPYIARVGCEDRTTFRVRRTVFEYDANYQPFVLPRITATFRNHADSASQTFEDVIPDTGADHSILSDANCESFALYESPYFTAVSGGVMGAGDATLIYRGKVEIAGCQTVGLIRGITGFQERMIGRDVLNQLRILFDGPATKVIVDP